VLESNASIAKKNILFMIRKLVPNKSCNGKEKLECTTGYRGDPASERASFHLLI